MTTGLRRKGEDLDDDARVGDDVGRAGLPLERAADDRCVRVDVAFTRDERDLLIDAWIGEWLADRPGAEHGDAEGRPRRLAPPR